MKTVIAVGLGSFIGGASRYLLATAIQSPAKSGFPYGTLLVNLLGCLLIGIVFSLAGKGVISPEWRLYLATGILGGFTTFSAFSMETVDLMAAGRFMQALTYVGMSVGLGLLATMLGFQAGRLFS